MLFGHVEQKTSLEAGLISVCHHRHSHFSCLFLYKAKIESTKSLRDRASGPTEQTLILLLSRQRDPCQTTGSRNTKVDQHLSANLTWATAQPMRISFLQICNREQSYRVLMSLFTHEAQSTIISMSPTIVLFIDLNSSGAVGFLCTCEIWIVVFR